MPYASDAQRRFFHAAEARGDISSKTVHEFDKASKGRKLPERAKGHTMGDGMLKGGTKYAAVSEEGKHAMHGAPGSHQESHKQIGGARTRIVTGHPDEMQPTDGRKE